MDIWESDKAILFIILFLPGFISLKVYDLVIAGEKRDFTKSIGESIVYSVLNFSALSWLIILVVNGTIYNFSQILQWISIIFIFIIMPAIWPFIFINLSRLNIFKQYLLDPINQPWDKFFDKRQAQWIVIHLRNGKTIRGKYSKKSSASSYPNERQIYIEELWGAGENGGFGHKIDRTNGVLLFESEILYIEFYK